MLRRDNRSDSHAWRRPHVKRQYLHVLQIVPLGADVAIGEAKLSPPKLLCNVEVTPLRQARTIAALVINEQLRKGPTAGAHIFQRRSPIPFIADLPTRNPDAATQHGSFISISLIDS